MKKLIPLMTCLMLSIMAFAQGGVDFQHLTFDEALAKAKAEKKLVFVDCYTTWCGPCKHMTTKIFPMKEAGDFFNPRFVCVKFDMEQGEGKELKTKLGVKAYPSFFIIRPDGSIQHSIVGGGELEPFIERVKKGLNEKTSLSYLQQQYEKGKMNKKQLLTYKTALDDAYDQKNAEKIQAELLSLITEKDKLKKEFWPLFEDSKCKVGTADFNLILANIPTFEKNIGKEKLDNYLFEAYSRALSPYIYGNKKRQTVPLEDLKQQIDKLNIEKKNDLLAQYKLADIVDQGNVNELLTGFESKASTLTGNELTREISAFNAMRDKVTKADYNRMLAVSNQILVNPENKDMKPFLEHCIDNWKSLAHVGVNFEELTFEQALEKAKKQYKRIFIDCYTSWCGPCKYMSNTVFPQEKMGDYLNPKFVCVKYDMEKGEGPELAKKFGVQAYPTFIILNTDGTVLHTLVGGGEPDQFIERVSEAFSDKATGLLDAKYKEGNRDKAFLVQYVESLTSNYSPEAAKVATELYRLLNDQEKVSKEYWFLFQNADLTPIGSEGYKYLLANRTKFAENNTQEAVDKRLLSEYQRKLMMIFYGRDTMTTAADLDQMRKEMMDLKLRNDKSLFAQINIAKAALTKNQNQLLAACEKEVGQISAEEFPFGLVAAAKETAAPSHIMNRWIKLCQKLIANCKDEDYAKRLQGFVDGLKEK